MTTTNNPLLSRITALMAKPKFKTIKVEQFLPLDYSGNVRDNHDITHLYSLVKNDGVINTPILVEEKPDGKLHILRGYRRATVAIKLHAEEPQDRRWDMIPCHVLEGLTEAERVYLTLDHAGVKGLEKHEVFYSAEKMFDARNGAHEAFTDKQVAIALEPLVDQHYPKDRAVKAIAEDQGEDLANYRRGIIQQFRNAHALPDVARAAYVLTLKGKQRWPNKKDVDTFVKLFKKAQAADPSYTTTKAAPGAEWTAAWDAYVKEHQAAEVEGRKPKPVGMMPAKTLEMFANASKSPLLKKIAGVILRTDKDGDKQWDEMDSVLVEMYTAMTKEQQQQFFNVAQ